MEPRATQADESQPLIPGETVGLRTDFLYTQEVIDTHIEAVQKFLNARRNVVLFIKEFPPHLPFVVLQKTIEDPKMKALAETALMRLREAAGVFADMLQESGYLSEICDILRHEVSAVDIARAFSVLAGEEQPPQNPLPRHLLEPQVSYR